MGFLDKLLGRKPAEPQPERTVVNHEEQIAPGHGDHVVVNHEEQRRPNAAAAPPEGSDADRI